MLKSDIICIYFEEEGKKVTVENVIENVNTSWLNIKLFLFLFLFLFEKVHFL